MKTILRIVVVLGAACGVLSRVSHGADRYWVNRAGGDFYTAGNWAGGSIPGPGDNAWFTSNATYQVGFSKDVTNANAYFDARGGTVTTWIRGGSPQTWRVTNTYVVGQSAGSTAAVEITAGTLIVTNAAHTGRLVVGAVGKGAFRVNSQYAAIIADQVLATNGARSVLKIGPGALTILRGSDVTNNCSSGFEIGTNVGGNVTSTLNLPGGIHRVRAAATYIGPSQLNYGSCGSRVNVSGAGTTWTNGDIIIGNKGQDSGFHMLTVSNGASVFGRDLYVGNVGQSRLVVHGTGSVFRGSRFLFCGEYGNNCLMIVTNGGKVFSPRGWIGDRGYPDGGRYGQRNAVVVSGAGSVWSNSTEAVVVGQRGLSNLVSVANGGALYAPLIALGYQASASNNAAVVAGAGSVLATPTIYVGSKGANSRMTATNSGTVRSSNVIFVGTDPTSTSNWLTVAGGKLYVTNSSGAALLDVRRGTLFIQGSGGACVADRLNLNVAAGVLKFVAAADGVTRIAVNSALTVDPTKAALIVDVAAYQTRYGPELTLVQYGSMSAPFTDVTISGLAGREVRFSQSAGNRITLTFLPAGTLMEIQ